MCGCGKEIPQITKRGKPRKYVHGHSGGSKKRENKLIFCFCGCEEQLLEFNKWGVKRKYINHHAMKSRKLPTSTAEQNKTRYIRNKKLAQKKGIIPSRYITKKCNFCGEIEKHFFNSTYLADGAPEYKSRCASCMKTYTKLNNKKNRKKLNEQATERKRKRKEQCIKYKGGKCNDCSYVGIGREMTFHHRPGVNKVKDISQMLAWSWIKLKSELDKCDLLCFRCHMKLEDKLIGRC